jgi:hypothetical protein
VLEVEFDLNVSPRQRLTILLGFFLAGIVSLTTVQNQSAWLKVLRMAMVGSGAIAGSALLWEYRPKEEEEAITMQATLIDEERQQLLSESEELEKRLQQWADEQAASWEKQYQDQAEVYEQAIAQLRGRIAELDGIKRPRGNSRIEWVANQIIDVLLEYEIPADYHDSHAIPGNDMVWVSPRDGVRIRKLKELAEEIQLRLKAASPPEIAVMDGQVQISIATDKSKTEVLTATRKKKGIVEPPATWFEEMVLSPDVNHLFVNGDTGSGKSTLIDNFICYAKKELGSQVDIVICDPKFPDSTWTVDGEEIIPRYKGYDRLVDEFGKEHESALDGLRAMHDDVRKRLSTAAQDKLAGREPVPRKPRIYVVDEAEDLVGEFKTEASDSIKSVLRVGRSTKVKAVIIGQNSGCKAYGMEKANLRNATQIYLRSNALPGVDQVASTAEEKKYLREQIALRQAAAESDRSKRYYGLVKYPGQPAFVALMPPPQSFNQDEDEEIEDDYPLSIEDLVEEAMHSELN